MTMVLPFVEDFESPMSKTDREVRGLWLAHKDVYDDTGSDVEGNEDTTVVMPTIINTVPVILSQTITTPQSAPEQKIVEHSVAEQINTVTQPTQCATSPSIATVQQPVTVQASVQPAAVQISSNPIVMQYVEPAVVQPPSPHPTAQTEPIIEYPDEQPVAQPGVTIRSQSQPRVHRTSPFALLGAMAVRGASTVLRNMDRPSRVCDDHNDNY